MSISGGHTVLLGQFDIERIPHPEPFEVLGEPVADR